VGWYSKWGYSFKHGWQILRRCTESDTHANTFSDPNRHSYADGDGNCNSDGKPESYSHAQGASNSTAPALTTHKILKTPRQIFCLV
jgi:hypothetical protein